MIGERGATTVAAFMDLALYHPAFGYYARAARRSGRAGDFFTSVDVGALFGEMLEVQIAEMSAILDQAAAAADNGAANPARAASAADPAAREFELVEAGAGSGRLSADILRAARLREPRLYERSRLHLVEVSAAARAEQRDTLGDVADRLASSSAELPGSFEGVVVANELLDALPTHQLVMRPDGLREVYVAGPDDAGRLQTREGPLSTPALSEYLKRLDVSLEPGWRVEVNLRAIEWIRDLAARLRRGFAILIDYGHEASELYSVTHSSGTLTSFVSHTMSGPESGSAIPPWLIDPGRRDITAHVDFTSLRAAAEAEGLVALAFLDQTYFLLGLASSERFTSLENPEQLKRRLALKTLLMPGGLGSTMKVLVLGKGVGRPALRGGSFRMRAT